MSQAIVAASRETGTPMAPLAGRKIVVTRPQAQAVGLSEQIRAAGGIAIWFPTIEIEPLADNAALDSTLARLAEFDLAIFISSNAVSCTFARLSGPWPAAVTAAVTGPGTAAALAFHGITEVIAPPAQFDSEGLIAELARRNLCPSRVLILRGEGGREWLADTLRAQGVQVDSVASYRRARAAADPRIVGRLADTGELAGVVVASSEGGDHMMAILGEAAPRWLADVPVFVPHARIADAMRAHGLSQVVLTAGGDAGLIAGMRAHFAGESR